MSNINVAPYYTNLINRVIEGGKYRNEIEVIQASLDLLEREHTQKQMIESALKAGEASGLAVPIDIDKFISEMQIKNSK